MHTNKANAIEQLRFIWKIFGEPSIDCLHIYTRIHIAMCIFSTCRKIFTAPTLNRCVRSLHAFSVLYLWMARFKVVFQCNLSIGKTIYYVSLSAERHFITYLKSRANHVTYVNIPYKSVSNKKKKSEHCHLGWMVGIRGSKNSARRRRHKKWLYSRIPGAKIWLIH